MPPVRNSVPSPDTFKGNLPNPASGVLEPGRLVKLSSGAPVYCDAGDEPFFLTRAPAEANEPDTNASGRTSVTALGGAGFVYVECQDAVTAGDVLYTAANGEASTTSSNGRLGVAAEDKPAGAGLAYVAVSTADLS